MRFAEWVLWLNRNLQALEPKRRPRPHHHRLGLERLEERCLPSVGVALFPVMDGQQGTQTSVPIIPVNTSVSITFTVTVAPNLHPPQDSLNDTFDYTIFYGSENSEGDEGTVSGSATLNPDGTFTVQHTFPVASTSGNGPIELTGDIQITDEATGDSNGLGTPFLYVVTDKQPQQDTLKFNVQPAGSAPGQPIDPAVQVEVDNSQGQPDTTAQGQTVSIALGPNTGNVSLDPKSTLTATVGANGVATFNNLIVATPGTYDLQASFNNVQKFSNQFTVGNELVWTGAGTSNAWSDPQNWNLNRKPINGDSLVFPTDGTGGQIIDNMPGLSLNSITINHPTTPLAPGWDLVGGHLALTGGVFNQGDDTFGIGTNLSGNVAFDSLSDTLTVDQSLHGGGLIVGGAGTVELTQGIAYKGPTDVQGTLQVDAQSVVGTSGTVTLENGGTIILVADNALGSGALDVKDGTLAILPAFAEATFPPKLSLANPVTLEGSLIVNSASHPIGGPSSNQTTPGVLELNGGLSVTSDSTINLGVRSHLSVKGPATLSVGAPLTIQGGTVTAGHMTGSGPVDVQNGDSLVLTAASPRYTGTVTAETGTEVAVGHSGALGKGTLDLKGGSTLAAFGPITLRSALVIDGSVNLSAPVDGGAFLNLLGNVTINGADTATLNPDLGPSALTFLGTFGGSGHLTFAGQGTVTLKHTSNQVSAENGVDLVEL